MHNKPHQQAQSITPHLLGRNDLLSVAVAAATTLHPTSAASCTSSRGTGNGPNEAGLLLLRPPPFAWRDPTVIVRISARARGAAAAAVRGGVAGPAQGGSADPRVSFAGGALTHGSRCACGPDAAVQPARSSAAAPAPQTRAPCPTSLPLRSYRRFHLRLPSTRGCPRLGCHRGGGDGGVGSTTRGNPGPSHATTRSQWPSGLSAGSSTCLRQQLGGTGALQQPLAPITPLALFPLGPCLPCRLRCAGSAARAEEHGQGDGSR
jgi:hypothetical protein